MRVYSAASEVSEGVLMHATQPWRTAAVTLLFVLAVAATPTRADDEEAARSSELAPAWTAKSFLNSEALTLEGLRGKLVFIEYFGTG